MKLAAVAALHKDVIHDNPQSAWDEYQAAYAACGEPGPEGFPKAQYKKMRQLKILKEDIELKKWPSAALHEICPDCFLKSSEFDKLKKDGDGLY